MKLENHTIEELVCGYTIDKTTGNYCCIHCSREFEKGEIFQIDRRFYEAAKAVEIHQISEHEDSVKRLLFSDSKYNTLTENQKQLLRLFRLGLSDKDVAREMGLAVSTVRHQKFTFREKAKQAKLYLAIYEGIFQQENTAAQASMDNILKNDALKREKQSIISIHDHATRVDERYVVTEEERDHILATSFSSLEPLKLRMFSPKEKKKIVILAKIAEQFEKDKVYSETELNEILAQIFPDHATLRRYLVDYGFFTRGSDGKVYQLNE